MLQISLKESTRILLA